MKEIKGAVKNIRGLLANTRYSIDYYQREYRWGDKHVSEVLDDLTGTFRTSRDRHGKLRNVADHDRYFLGSIVISESAGRRFITDGQQRLTTVTLLLIALRWRLPAGHQRTALSQLIYSYHSGETSFNLDVDDRTACMDALFRRRDFEDDGKSESVTRMVENYRLIEEKLTDVLSDSTPSVDGDEPLSLEGFIDWLIENVHFIEVTASSDADAYSIFETMNDRGLQLTPAELLKSYLLSRIDPGPTRDAMNETWRNQVARLRKELGYERADADAIKTWLRSQYMQLTTGHAAGTEPDEPDRARIDSEFHRWVGDNNGRLGLHASDDYRRFIEQDFDFYTRWYEAVQRASSNWTDGLESVYRNRCSGLRDRNDLYLASLVPGEDDAAVLRKVRTVAAFIEVVVARLSWKGWIYNYSSMYDVMQRMVLKIRGKAIDEIVGIFESAEGEWWFEDGFKEPSSERGGWSGNRRRTHRLLARMTEYVEVQSGGPSRYEKLVQTGAGGYDVEHIWANHWERHSDEYPQKTDFEHDRNRIGGLVLLPRSVNQSLRDKTFDGNGMHINTLERRHFRTRSLPGTSWRGAW